MEKYSFSILINDIPTGYEQYQAKAGIEFGAFVFSPIKNFLLKALYKIHFSWKVNQRINLPFKKIWFSRCFSKKYKTDDNILFIVYESFHMAYTPELFKYLKHKFPHSLFAFVFTNPPGSFNQLRLQKVKKYYNFVVTDIEELALKNNYLFYPINPFSLPKIDKPFKYDVCFIGANKGRLMELISIFQLFKNEGLNALFYITGVDKSDAVYADEIHYNQFLKYDEVIQIISESKSILEIVQDNLNYYTFRVYESMLMHRQLITTNIGFKKSPLYSSKTSYIFSKDNYVNGDFKKFLSVHPLDNDYPNRDIWSYKRFIDFLLANFKEE